MPQNPADEPAGELLKRIEKEKAKAVQEGKLKKAGLVPEIKEEEKSFGLPEGWTWVRVGSITNNVDYGTSEKATDKGDIPILRMGNVQDAKIVLSNLKYVSKEIKDLPYLFLKKQDLIFNRTNSYELVGKCGVFLGEDDEYTLASYLILVSIPKEMISVDYINYYINSTICRKSQIEPNITQQTGQANFSGGKLKNIADPLPPFSEHQSIVAKIEEFMALCDGLKGTIEKGETPNCCFLKPLPEMESDNSISQFKKINVMTICSFTKSVTCMLYNKIKKQLMPCS